MAARWNLLMTSSLCLVFCSLCMTEQSSEDRGAMRQVGRQVYEYNNHTYTFHYQTRVTWEEARDICASESKGSYLAVIEDMDEAKFVADAMAGRVYNFLSLQDVWIGGNYVIEPSRIREKECLLLGRFLTNKPKFQNLLCNRRRSFLCEIAPEELGEDFLGKINNTLSNKKKAGLLFLMDESGRVLRNEFQMDLTAYQALAKGLQLSANRDAGIITFNHTADADIHLGTNDLCDFYDETEEYFYRDFMEIVLIAEKTVELNSADEYTLVFLVWDGMNTTNPTPATDKLKSMGQIEFPTEYWYYDRILVEPLAQDDEGPRYFFGSFYCPGKRLQRFT